MKCFLPFVLFFSLSFGDSNKTNSIGIEFVFIPSGSFMMGCDEDNGFCWEDEAPRHQVIISKPFYLGKYEVTQKQWQTLIGHNPSKVKGDDLPITNISWNDAVVFIKKLNEKEGVDKYRLPSEAEWEYAIRAGTNTRYFWGNNGEDKIKSQYAWLNERKIQKVGQKKPNAWGLYDMAGNVWEWVNDLYQENYYQYSPIADPKGADFGSDRVMRGGSYEENINFARSAFRKNGYYEGVPSNSYENIGFRLAMSVDEKDIKETFRIDFDTCYVKAYLFFSANNEYISGFIAVFDKKNDKKLINVGIEDMYVGSDLNKTAVNLQKIAHDNKIIIYDDFNFDGKKDFAIRNGEAGTDYMYEVYLHTAGGFSYSENFSRLTYEGMFNIDKKNRKLDTVKRDGCCSHTRDEFEVISKDELKLSKSFTRESFNDPYINYHQTIWSNNTARNNSWIELDFETFGTAKPIFSFVSDKNDKKIVVFIDSSKYINYTLLGKNGHVEFGCPIPYGIKADGECEWKEDGDVINFYFKEESNKTVLSFTNKNTTYYIYESKDDFGIDIKIKDGKIYKLNGRQGSKKGSLKEALNAENIVRHDCGQ
ncbi:MAG: formylglycine-generating enzyme family protein [Campylobacteraceae bacterium]|jgi:formylglycine-generating enzyme required for sulfatase activity|nr:formylglycine-generating enzyme family protein [Campylobacteraceae bacterium]